MFPKDIGEFAYADMRAARARPWFSQLRDQLLPGNFRQFEQFLNAWHVREMGFGDFSTSRHPTPEIFDRFEQRLDVYRQNIQAKFADGTDLVINRVRELITECGQNKR